MTTDGNPPQEATPLEIKEVLTKPKADQYDGLHNSHQTFPGIGLLEAVQGMIVLRGRKGQRDVLFPVDKAVQKYYDTMQTVAQYAKYGVAGWDTLKDIADDLKVRIKEACEQLTKMNRPVPEEAVKLLADDK